MQLSLLNTGDGSPTLFNSLLNATYHSHHGAIAESRHIFIEQGLSYARGYFGNTISILEIGFGTGLNALLTLKEAREHDLNICYTAIEKYPVSIELAMQLNYPELIDKTLEPAFSELHSETWDRAYPLSAQFELRKFKTDILNFDPGHGIHLVYYDAFAPGVSPEMWGEKFMTALYSSMLPGACLVTFCAKGEIKRLFKRLGFEVQTLPGPPGKREMTRALKPRNQ